MYRRIILLVLAIPLLGACSSVKVRYDHRADFHRYKRYAYEIQKPVIRGLDRNEARLILNEIDAKLKSAGLYATRSHPDLLVRIRLDFNKRIDVYDSPYRWRHRYQKQSKEGWIDIDLLDARTKQSVWRGRFYLQFTNTRDLMRKLSRKLDQLFKKYPPA